MQSCVPGDTFARSEWQGRRWTPEYWTVMSVTLPGEAATWIDTYRRRLNDNDDFVEATSGWGVDFDGDFVLEILPDDVYDGEPVVFYLALEDGTCLEADVLADPDELAHGFALRGSYTDWKRLIQGELDIVPAVMNGTLDVDGSKMRAMRYQQAFVEMGETARGIDTDFEY